MPVPPSPPATSALEAGPVVAAGVRTVGRRVTSLLGRASAGRVVRRLVVGLGMVCAFWLISGHTQAHADEPPPGALGKTLQTVLKAPGQTVLKAPGQTVLKAPGQTVLKAPGRVLADSGHARDALPAIAQHPVSGTPAANSGVPALRDVLKAPRKPAGTAVKAARPRHTTPPPRTSAPAVNVLPTAVVSKIVHSAPVGPGRAIPGGDVLGPPKAVQSLTAVLGLPNPVLDLENRVLGLGNPVLGLADPLFGPMRTLTTAPTAMAPAGVAVSRSNDLGSLRSCVDLPLPGNEPARPLTGARPATPAAVSAASRVPRHDAPRASPGIVCATGGPARLGAAPATYRQADPAEPLSPGPAYPVPIPGSTGSGGAAGVGKAPTGAGDLTRLAAPAPTLWNIVPQATPRVSRNTADEPSFSPD
jgi:hypothetical protein